MLNLAVTGCGTQCSTSTPRPMRAAAERAAQDGTAPLLGPTTAAASPPTQAAPPPRPCAAAVPGRSSATDYGARPSLDRRAQPKDAGQAAPAVATAVAGTSAIPTSCEEARAAAPSEAPPVSSGGGADRACSHPGEAATPTWSTPPSESPTRARPVTLSDAFRGYTRQRVFDDTPRGEDRRSSEQSSASRQSGSRSSHQSQSPMPPGDIVALSLDAATLSSPAATRPASVQPASMLSSWLRSTITGGGAHGTQKDTSTARL